MFFGPSAQTFSATSSLINFFWFSLRKALKRSLKNNVLYEKNVLHFSVLP